VRRVIPSGKDVAVYGIAALASFVAVGAALARSVDVPTRTRLQASETVDSLRLTPAESQQLFGELESHSFDVPDSWEKEIRGRRVSLGPGADGIILQGTDLLCGATGNCQTFVLRRANGRWTSLFEQDAPLAASFALLETSSSQIRDLLVATNESAESIKYTLYTFAGAFYRASACRETARALSKVTCE